MVDNTSATIRIIIALASHKAYIHTSAYIHRITYKHTLLQDIHDLCSPLFYVKPIALLPSGAHIINLLTGVKARWTEVDFISYMVI